VSIPVEYLGNLRLTTGAVVDVTLEEKRGKIVIEPVRKTNEVKGIGKKIVSQVIEFTEKYRPALQEPAAK